MKKDIVNVDPVIPIVRKPRISNHKTFGENVINGDFTFNNNDYLNSKLMTRIFGSSKFIRMLWRLLIPTVVWGLVTSLVSILFTLLVPSLYPSHSLGDSVYQAFTFTLSKFGYINVIVATAWVLIGNPVIGNYIGRNQPEKIREVSRFILYIITLTSVIAIIFEYIYAPWIAEHIIFRNLNNNISLNIYKAKFSIDAIKIFAFTTFFVGISSIFTPMFSTMRKNHVLIASYLLGVIFFVIVYPSYFYTHHINISSDATGSTIDNVTLLKFHDLVINSCVIYLFYYVVVDFSLITYTLFPRFFKKIGFKISVFFKNMYNSAVDKQSKIEYNILKNKRKQFKLKNKLLYKESKIKKLENIIQYRTINKVLSSEKLEKLNNKLNKKIAKYKKSYEITKASLDPKINNYEVIISDLQNKFDNTPTTTKKLFYIDYNAYEHFDDYEKYFVFFSGQNDPIRLSKFKIFLINKLHVSLWNNRTTSYFAFRVSFTCMKNVWVTSFGLFVNQFAYGIISLLTIIYSQNYIGNILGIQDTYSITSSYYRDITVNASNISTYLGYIYAGVAILPQYFVSYYLGRNDKETAYHNSRFLMNWSFIVGILFSLITLLFTWLLSHYVGVPPHKDGYLTLTIDKKSTPIISLNNYYNSALIIGAILAIVEVFDVSTSISYWIFTAGASKWSFFCDQIFRIGGAVGLICLQTLKTPGVLWFNSDFKYNLYIYYLIGRIHSVIPAIVSWVFIERGLALRVVNKSIDEEITPDILVKERINEQIKNKLNRKSEIVL